MADDLLYVLRARHNDTWPVQIGHGDLINEDGPEAANRIEELEKIIQEKDNHIRKLERFIAWQAQREKDND